MLGTLSIERDEDKINFEEVNYWKRMIKSNLKIGVEIETNLEPSQNRYDATDKLKETLKPTGNYGNFGKAGVIEVKGDGSLSNGIELVTTGRRLNFLDYYSQYRTICTQIFKYNPILNERCGLHNHLLMDYGSSYNSLEKPMPGIILKNFIQLIKRHLPELVWITSTVNTSNSITRMENFCTADTLIPTTPLTRNTKDFVSKVSEGGGNGSSRYKFVNFKAMYSHVEGNNINRFHLELRFPDGSLFPAQISAQNMLYASMLIKAVELSELGIINCGNAEVWEETKTLYKSLRQEGSYDRTSNPPTSTQKERIKERARDMLLEFKAQLDSFDTHIYGVLSILAETPISLMRREQDDKNINIALHSIIENMYEINIEDFKAIIETINLNKINKANNEIDYKIKLANRLGMSQNELNNKLFKLNMFKPLSYDNILGSLYFK